MKRLLIVLLFICLIPYESTYAHEVKIKMRTQMNIKTTKPIPADTVITINSFAYEFDYVSYKIRISFGLTDGRTFDVTHNKVGDMLDYVVEDVQDLWNDRIITDVIPSMGSVMSSSNADIYQHSLRREMEADALDYISMIKENGLEFVDPFLESYLYSLVVKIAPKYLLDGRPSNVNLVIQQNPTANACCFPNGTIVINTGLLAALHSEDELVAILSHEIAHFILDHAVKNVNERVKRQNRAEFWAGLATVITAVTEGVIAANNRYYMPGAATATVAAMSSSIATNVIEQSGMAYNIEQEREADELAKEVLVLLGYDRNALATALSRMEKIYIEERNQAMYFDSETHPSLVGRIKKAGTPSEETNVKYEQMVSFAITNAALMKYGDRRFRQCIPLATQNINNGVAIADDYILKAQCLLSLEDTPETNKEVLELLGKAKEFDASNINIDKVEIIATLRLGKNEQALQILTEYIAKLSQMNEELSGIYDQDMWAATKQFVLSEKRWANNMITKIKGMINT